MKKKQQKKNRKREGEGERDQGGQCQSHGKQQWIIMGFRKTLCP